MAASDTSSSPLSARFDLVGKIVVGVAAIAYAIGVFLVSSDLAKYKVSQFSLARPQYVLAGGVWLVTTVVATGLPFLMAVLTKFGDFTERGKFGRIYFAILSVICSGFAFTTIINVVMPSAGFWSIVPYAFFAETVFFLIAWANLPSAKEADANHDGKKKISLVPSGIGFGLIALFLWTTAYNISIFPNVEPSLGGGKHPTGHVVFCQPKEGEELQLAAMLGPIKQTNLTTNKSLEIVLVDADFVVLAYMDKVPEEYQHGVRKVLAGPVIGYKTVLIKKILVASILYD